MDVAPWKTLRGCEEPTVCIFSSTDKFSMSHRLYVIFVEPYCMAHTNLFERFIKTDLLRPVKLVPVLKLLTPGKLVTERHGQFVMVLVLRSKFPKMLVNSQFLFDSQKKLLMVISNSGI